MSYDLRFLRHFEAVYRLRSFSKAAAELGMTHSAITKSIRTLEENWDVRLFERTTRSVAPTEQGHRLAARAHDLLSFSEMVKTETIATRRRLGVICGPAILDTFIRPAIRSFRSTYPDVPVDVETMPPEIAADRLMQRRAQLLLIHSRIASRLSSQHDLRISELASERYFAVFRPEHPAASTDMSLDALLAFDWVVAGFDTAYQAALSPRQREALRQRGFPKYRVLSQATCLEMVMESDLLTIVPFTAMSLALRTGALRAIPFPDGARFSISAVTLSGPKPAEVVLAFAEAVRSTLNPQTPAAPSDSAFRLASGR